MKHASKKVRKITITDKLKKSAIALFLSTSLHVIAAETYVEIPAQPLDKALNALFNTPLI
jgi:hypothetical protein